jgi:hypothetical protein
MDSLPADTPLSFTLGWALLCRVPFLVRPKSGASLFEWGARHSYSVLRKISIDGGTIASAARWYAE